MRWTQALLMLLAAAVLAAPAPVSFGIAAATGAPMEDYAAREASASGLEQFTGGWQGVVITLVVVAAVVYLVLWIWDHEHYSHEPAHPPPPEPRP
jgi:purine-cytosine permease-like protein